MPYNWLVPPKSGSNGFQCDSYKPIGAKFDLRGNCEGIEEGVDRSRENILSEEHYKPFDQTKPIRYACSMNLMTKGPTIGNCLRKILDLISFALSSVL